MFCLHVIKRRALAALLFTAALGVAGCATTTTTSPAITGSGVSRTETRPIAGVTAVTLAAPGQMNLQQGDAESLTVTADDNLLPHLKTTVAGGVLTIAFEEGSSYTLRTDAVYTLTLIELDALRTTGSGEISAASLSAGDLRVETTGSGSIQLGALAVSGSLELALGGSGGIAAESAVCELLRVSSSGSGSISVAQVETSAVEAALSGAGSVTLLGSAPNQTITIEGNGDFNGEGLQGIAAVVKTSGQGSAHVNVSEALDATVSGSGSILYSGSPEVSANDTGSGEVKPASA